MKCSFKHEKTLHALGRLSVGGIDEAGRGPLAGPVVAAVVILPLKFRHRVLTDSKALSAAHREALYAEIVSRGDICWAVAVVSTEEVDRLNILRAAHEAMRRAVASLTRQPDHVLIDGLPVRPFPIEQTALVDGDARSFSIAAASVIAKVTRDRLMVEYDAVYPQYGFAQHKGYATALHRERLSAHGPCPIHRRSFLPMRQTTFPFACTGGEPAAMAGAAG